MALDPNIILQGQQLQLQNPLDTAVKAMQLRDLSQQSQLRSVQAQSAQQEFSDNQAMRQAYKDNLVTRDDGSQTVDRAGVLSSLNKQNPMLAAKANANFQQMDIDQQQRFQTMTKDAFMTVPTDPNVPLADKQAAWSAARQRLMAAGVPGIENSPPEYQGDSWMRSHQTSVLSFGEQLAQKQQQTDQWAKAVEARAKAVDAGLGDPGMGPSGGQAQRAPQQQMANRAAPNMLASNGQGIPGQQGQPYKPSFQPPPKMQAEGMKAYLQNTESSRQRPDAAQALKDIQSAQKINEGISQAPGGDLNKLNNNQVRLITGELVKMATGGAPTETELESLTPNNVAQKYGAMLQNLTNKSAPSNAAEFVQQFRDYANGIAKQGADRITQRSNDIADALRPQLGEQSYKLVKGQIANEFKDIRPSSGSKYSPDVSDYAAKHSISEAQAAQIKALRTSQAGNR